MSWFEANETCRNMGARLVEINSEEENDQVVDEINRIGFRNKHFWIGLTDLEEEGVWRFESNGSEPQYTNWHYNEPDNNTDADCVRLKKPTNQWKWGDFPCNLSSYNDNDFTIHAICESDLATAGESLSSSEGEQERMRGTKRTAMKTQHTATTTTPTQHLRWKTTISTTRWIMKRLGLEEAG